MVTTVSHNSQADALNADRQEMHRLALESFAQQFVPHLRDAIANYIGNLTATVFCDVSEAARDELVDAFMHDNKNLSHPAMEKIHARAKAFYNSDYKLCNAKLGIITSLYGILHDDDIMQNMAAYTMYDQAANIHKLFSPPLSSADAINTIKSLCRTACGKCDSRLLHTQSAMHVADELWGYSPQSTEQTGDDPEYLKAAAMAIRQNSFNFYMANGGMLIEPDVLRDISRQNILKIAENILVHWCDNKHRRAELIVEFQQTNAKDDFYNESPDWIKSWVPDYDACGKGLCQVIAEMNYTLAKCPTYTGMKTPDMLADSVGFMFALHRMLHDPETLHELSVFCRTNNSNSGQFPTLKKLSPSSSGLMEIIRQKIRNDCHDINAIKNAKRRIQSAQRKTSRVANSPQSAAPIPTAIRSIFKLLSPYEKGGI